VSIRKNEREYQKIEKYRKKQGTFDIYKNYQDELFKNKFYDFQIWIMECKSIVRVNLTAGFKQESHQYIL